MTPFKKFHYTFPSGQMLITATISQQVNISPVFSHFIHRSVQKHLRKDWGDCSPLDKELNDDALTSGLRITSVYNLPTNLKILEEQTIWIITEADRSCTTILFPSDY